MDDATLQKIADGLLEAYGSGVAVPPPTESAALTLADAYEVQLKQVERWTTEGATVSGHKVGLTSEVMRRQLNVDRPDYGHLLDRMFHLEHLPIAADRFLQPLIEPEIAFVLKKPLVGPGVNVATAIAAVDFVLPALEIVDSRVRDWKITLPDTVADNASSGGVVLGSRPTLLSDVDLAHSRCVLRRGEEELGRGVGGAVLGTPINALVWLADTLGELGLSLNPGDVILPGSLTAAAPVRAGDTFTASFAGLGDVTAVFA